MAPRISRRSAFNAASRALVCAFFTLAMAMPARIPMIVTTTISSMSVNPRCSRRDRRGIRGDRRALLPAWVVWVVISCSAFVVSIGSPFVVVRLAVEGQRGGLRVHLEDVVGGGDRRAVGFRSRGENGPFRFAGHRVDQIALPEQAYELAVAQFDRLGQLFEVLRIGVLRDDGRNLDAVRTRSHPQVVIAVDGLGDPAQPGPEVDLLLPADAEADDRQGHRSEDRDHGDDRDQFGDRESPAGCGVSAHDRPAQSTFARPPTTWAVTVSPRAL